MELEIVKKQFYEPIKNDWITQSGGLSEADFMREVSFAIQHIHKTPLLQKCDQNSFLKAVINLSQVGLTLNPISKYAYLIPRWNNNKKMYEAVLEPDYRGLQKLLTDSGAVKSISCNIVFEGDDIEIDMSMDKPVVKHVPHWLRSKPEPKGTIKGAYSLAVLADGSYHFEGMSYADICDIKSRSESYKAYLDKKITTCIWVSDEPEMCRKTVIKRHYKYLPKSDGEKHERFQKAVDLDNQVNGFDEPVDFGLQTVIEQLIWNSSLDEKKKERLTQRMVNLTNKNDAFQMIEELKDSQPIIGIDRTAITQYEISQAVKDRADRDDFQERNKVNNGKANS